MTLHPRLPRVAAWLLRLMPLGEHRSESEADLAELFASRRHTHGRVHATRRLVVDLLSVATPKPGLGAAVHDMRFGLRLFRRHSGIVGVTIVGLGLAIAMCTTVFSILNATVLRPFEMDDPSTVVGVQRLFERGMTNTWPYSAFIELQRSAGAMVEASVSDSVRFAASANATDAASASILFVSGGYLRMLGGRAELGRTLEPSDDRPDAAPVVVISHSFWLTHFNGDHAVVGRTIPLGQGSATVAGVLRQKFSGPLELPPSFWAPFSTYGGLYGDAAIGPSSGIQVDIVARTPVGGATALQNQLSSLASRLPATGFGASDAAPGLTTGVHFESKASRIGGPDAGSFYIVIAIIFLIVGLVLALACANVANLLLAGASTRAREFGVRIAMGASGRRLMRQLLSESLLVGAVAGAFGFLLSMWMVPLLARIVGLPASYDVSPDLTVMAFTTVIALVAGLGAGLAPARFGARSDIAGVMKSQSLQSGTSPTASRLRRGFIGFQAAASMLLLVTAALFLRAAVHITGVDLGFDANRLVTVTTAFPDSTAAGSGDEDAPSAYWRTALERVRALPSVEGTSLALYSPFGGEVASIILNRNGSEYTIVDNHTAADYFQTAGFKIVRGRAYTADEVAGRAPVVVVSESLVRDLLNGVEPVGAPLSAITSITSPRDNGVTIIGVVADAVIRPIRDAGGNGAIYRPIDPTALAGARLVIRSPQPAGVVREVETVLTQIDPRVRLTSTVVADDVERYLNEPRMLAGLAGAVSLLALVLSVLGIFGVTSFVVGQRTQEVSVRMAVGASATDVVRLLIRQNVLPVAGGLAVGLAIALAGSRVLTGALSGISPYDALAIVPAVAVLSVTALAAIAVPALRAARTDPASLLRQ